ncbi:MAG: stringent starvation protein A [Gammaproteobacteria bacterium]|jgi:stringent starvation protein A|nr:stringent starvation protein A [Gammaproteobacteria bacterium]MBT7308497.1 stringent starvation protein A [Gammaproteobacteria bacterium]
MTIANRRSVMVLFSGPLDHFSHRVRIVMAEKGILHEIESVDLSDPQPEFIELSPYQKLPTVADRDLTLFGSQVIMEYLDERFPHPPLMPVDPVARANVRQMIARIDLDWSKRMEEIEQGSDKVANQARAALSEGITMLAPLFAQQPYFMSEEFSLVDCSLAPILWRLKSLNVRLPTIADGVTAYAERIFERDSFLDSLTEEERELDE